MKITREDLYKVVLYINKQFEDRVNDITLFREAYSQIDTDYVGFLYYDDSNEIQLAITDRYDELFEKDVDSDFKQRILFVGTAYQNDDIFKDDYSVAEKILLDILLEVLRKLEEIEDI